MQNQPPAFPARARSEGRSRTEHELFLSIVIPVYNEADNVVHLAEETVTAMTGLEQPWELIFVDDGSTDATGEKLQALAAARPEIRVLHHAANTGQSAAVASGFAIASGAWIGTLDGDGQNDPADLLRLLRRCEQETADCATGVRVRRMDNRLRRLCSRVANKVRNFLTGDRIADSGCGVRVMRREGLSEVPVFNGMHRFLPTLLRAQGLVVVEQEVNHRQRTHGISKYGIGNRAWRGIRDCFAMRWYLARAIPARRVKLMPTGKNEPD